tara:strand:- start:55 stop:702 length:648 start_codon:yes stop_codon:yes gene_type:complete
MKSEVGALKRLTNSKSKVSSHYLIKRNGDIIILVPDLYIAWHAGKSYWKNLDSLNKNSIGIEICNPGHKNNYKEFSEKQIKSIFYLSRNLINKYNIKIENILGHSDIAPLRKKDPGEKFPWSLLAKKKICIWHSLSKNFLEKNRFVKITNDDEKFFFKNLLKIGYTFKNSKKIKNKFFLKLIIKAFQRRFRQETVDGKIDRECFLISENIAKKLG